MSSTWGDRGPYATRCGPTGDGRRSVVRPSSCSMGSMMSTMRSMPSAWPVPESMFTSLSKSASISSSQLTNNALISSGVNGTRPPFCQTSFATSVRRRAVPGAYPTEAAASQRFLLRIQRVPQTVADDVEGQHRDGDGQARVHRQPRVAQDVVHTGFDHVAPAGPRRLHAQAQEAQAGLGPDG